MEILAINSSPKMSEGNTAQILNPFLEGMREAGANVELFYARKLKVNPCQGDYVCWLKTPGRCIHKDDMEMLLPKLARAEVWVFASPLYVDGISGAMKNILERMIPLVEPFYELRDGHCRHPRRAGTKTGKVLLVSSCGFWELDNFDPLLVHIEAVCKNIDREFAGALLRPHARAMGLMIEDGSPINDIFTAAKEAGRQFVTDGRMSSDTLKTVSRNLMPLKQLKQRANQLFKQILNKAL